MTVIESKKKLGFGMMRLPERTDTEKGELDNIDVEQVKEMVDTFIARGFTYFDTAWMYHNKNSEQVVKLALTDRYAHDRYTLADKYHLAYVKDGTPEEVFLAQLERCGVEYFDYYLLHDMGHDNYGKLRHGGKDEGRGKNPPRGLFLPRQSTVPGSGADGASGTGVRPDSAELPGLGQSRNSGTGSI